MDSKKLITDYLQEARVMQIATVKDGKPWVCTVNFAIDSALNFIWVSLRSTRHSQEIKTSPFVAGTIVKDPTKIQGIQFEGIAEEVSSDKIQYANEIYEKRYGHNPERLAEAQSKNPNARAYYKIKPSKIVLFDKVNFPDNPRQEVSLE